MANRLAVELWARNAVRRGLSSAAASFRRFRRRVRNIGRSVGRVFTQATKAVLAVGAALVLIVRQGHQFRQEMANVSTMLDDVGMKLLPAMTKGLLKMSGEFGQSTSTLSKGLYDILSAGIPAADAMKVLEVASRAAIGGMTDTATSVDALTTVLNSYGLEASRASDVSDVLFQIVKDGKITYAQLAENIGKLAPTAKTAGMTIREMGAAIATMVKVEAPERAMTAIRAAMFHAAKAGETLFDLVRKFKGADLETILGAGIEKRAAQGVAILANNFDVLEEEMKKFQDVSGAAGAAYEKNIKVKHWARLWKTLLAQVTKFGMVIDKALGPAIDRVRNAIAKMSEGEGFAKLTETTKKWAENAADFVTMLTKSETAGKAIKLAGQLLVEYFLLGARKAIRVLWRGIVDAFKAGSKWIGHRALTVGFSPEERRVSDALWQQKHGLKVDEKVADGEKRIDALLRKWKELSELANKPGADPGAVSELSDAEKLAQLEEDRVKAAADLAKRKAEIADDEMAARENAEKKARLERELVRIGDAEAAIRKRLAAAAALGIIPGEARGRVAAFVEAKKAQKAQADALAAEDKRASKLEEKEKRGIRLSKEDQAFLAARAEMAAKRLQAQQDNAKLLALEAARAKIQKDQRDILAKIEKQNAKLLQMG